MVKTESKHFRWALSSLVLAGLVASFPAKALAIPSLELFIDPDDNIGTGWDEVSETWVYQGEEPQFVLEAFALDSDLGSGEGDAFPGTDTTANLAIALRGEGLDAGIDPTTLGSIEIEGAVINTWTFGTPPEGVPPGGRLPPHGIYPTWYAVYSFDFGSFGEPVFDTHPIVESIVTKPGWHRFLDVNYAGLNGSLLNSVHFDLYTLAPDGQIHRNNPFSHDAEAVLGQAAPVPEPATLGLLGVGLLGFMARRRSRAGGLA